MLDRVVRAALFAALAALPLVGGCGRTVIPGNYDLAPTDGGTGSPDLAGDMAGRVLTSIAVTPPLSTLAVKTGAFLQATGTFSDNSTMDLTAAAKWSSDTPSVASVGASGAVIALAPGTAMITASFGGVSGRAQVKVTVATIVSITINPQFANIAVGAVAQFTATAILNDGSKQDVTATAIWSFSSPNAASVSPGGLVRGLSAGGGALTADVGSVRGTAKVAIVGAQLSFVQVTPTNPVVGLMVTFPFTAIATYNDGSIADVTAVAAWSSSAPAVLSVDGKGLATTLAPGTSIVTAVFAGVSGTTTATVTSAKLLSIDVKPATATLAVGVTVKLTATGHYSDNTSFDLTESVIWSSSAAGVASVSNAQGSRGLVTALSAGGATVAATLGAVSGTTQITVTPAQLLAIAITPPNPSVPRNTTVQFIARGTYSDKSVVDLTAMVTWASSDPGVATISNALGSNGLASAMALGVTTVTAALGNLSAETALTVTNAKLVSITVALADANLVVGLKTFATATGNFNDGTTVDLTTACVWSSGAVNIATVSNAPGAQGEVAAVSVGMTAIVATFMGVSGSTTLTVTAPTLLQVVVAPIDPSVPIGQQVQFSATAIYSNGVSQNVTQQAKWSSSDGSVATISNFGRTTAQKAGKTTITANFGGLSGSTILTVTGAVVVSISVAPIDQTYPAGTVQGYSATAIYSDNTSQNVTGQATWISSSPNVAAVGDAGFNKGRVTCLAAGQTTISATWMGLTGGTTVTVSAAVLVAVSVFPAQLSVPVGAVRQFTAQAIYSDNTSMDITGAATWVSSAPNVAGVADNFGAKGRMTAIAPGMAVLSVTFQGITGTSAVTVTQAKLVAISLSPVQPSVPKGVPVAFRAIAFFDDNTSQDVTALATWLSSNAKVAAVSDAAGSKGVTQTLAAGNATVSATWMGVTGTTAIAVTPATLTTVQLTPFTPTLPVGFAISLTATGIYSDNTTLDITAAATWISSDGNVAAVSDANGSKGRLSPLAPGQASLSATYQGVTGTDLVTVSKATLTSIAITPAGATLGVGGFQQLTATGKFSDNSQLDITTYVTWLSSTPAVASISNAAGTQGQAKGLSPGATTVTAVRGNISGTTVLTIK